MKHIKKWVYEYVEGRIGYWLEEARTYRAKLKLLALKSRRVECSWDKIFVFHVHYRSMLNKALRQVKKWKRIKRFFSKYKWMHIHG
jgi:hypothetical protein